MWEGMLMLVSDMLTVPVAVMQAWLGRMDRDCRIYCIGSGKMPSWFWYTLGPLLAPLFPSSSVYYMDFRKMKAQGLRMMDLGVGIVNGGKAMTSLV